MVCTWSPARAREAPTNTQVRVIGRRMDQMIRVLTVSPFGPAASVFRMVDMSIPEEPTQRSVRRDKAAAITAAVSTMILRLLMLL